MIIDEIKNWKLYFKEPIFEKIFKDLSKFSLETPNGTYKDNEDYYFKVMSYKTNTQSKVIESHRKEVDVQILLEGKEKINIFNSNAVEVTEKYDEASDCQFYKKIGKPVVEINLQPNYMAIFFPQDIHEPTLAVDNKLEVLKKIVIKIDEKFFA